MLHPLKNAMFIKFTEKKYGFMIEWYPFNTQVLHYIIFTVRKCYYPAPFRQTNEKDCECGWEMPVLEQKKSSEALGAERGEATRPTEGGEPPHPNPFFGYVLAKNSSFNEVFGMYRISVMRGFHWYCF